MSMSCSAIANRPDGDLLAGRDHRIIFAGVEDLPRLQCGFAPAHELIGGSRHRRHDDGDIMAGIDLALDVTRDVADAIDIGDRSAAEFHYQTGHDKVYVFTGTSAATGVGPAGAKGAYA